MMQFNLAREYLQRSIVIIGKTYLKQKRTQDTSIYELKNENINISYK